MSGATNLKGLVFQQRYTTYRVLIDVAERAMFAEPVEPHIRRFSIEGRASEDSPVWDIRLELDNDDVELTECKDTAITRKDRLTFYDRLRKEVASGTLPEKIQPMWTTDPTKQTPNALTYIDEIASTVADMDLTTVTTSQPKRVDSTVKAIQEAVFRLCHYTGQADDEKKNDAEDGATENESKTKDLPSPCTLEEAKTLLSRLQVKRYRFADLDRSVKLLMTGVLTKGVANAVNKYVTGVLSERIIQVGKAEFTIDEFFQEIGTTAIGIEVEGRLRDLLSFGAASENRPAVRLIEWRNIPDSPVTRWELIDRLPSYNPTTSVLILAPMGAGKTVASHLALEKAAELQSPDRVLRVEAGALKTEDIESLVKLVVILTGVGPTWLTIDALDEASTQFSSDWKKAISALLSLPDLVLMVTVRKEVFAVREWISDSTSTLPRMEMALLDVEQVENAFSTVGLPIPVNPELLLVLQNPFLFSLYANIVSADDMPLSESGEVTAFKVIAEFWNRRVIGVSVGQRAVGDSETSQAKKQRAAAFLGEMSLHEDALLVTDIVDQDILSGIEMLAREGVIERVSTIRVRWVHEWLREYSLVDQLLTRCEAVSGIAIARRIVSDCTLDHVSRAAAAGAMKWVIATPDAGTPTEFLRELWLLHKGLARDSLVIALEAQSSSLELAALPEDVLVEAVILAKHLGANQWQDQIAKLPEGRFQGDSGGELHRVVVDFELDAASDMVVSTDTVVRLVSRDLVRSKAGHSSFLRTFDLLRQGILATDAVDHPIAQEWLVGMAGVSNQYLFGKLFDSVTTLLESDRVQFAHATFRATIRLDDPTNGPIVAQAIVTGRFAYERQLKEVLDHPGLVANNIDTWGVTSVELLQSLVLAKQRDSWPLNFRLFDALANQLGIDEGADHSFHPNLDQDPRLSTLDCARGHNYTTIVAETIQRTFANIVSREDEEGFHYLANRCINTGFAAVIVFPLLAVYDALRAVSQQHKWHEREAMLLLKEPLLANLESLDDVRRLIRIQLLGRLNDTALKEIVDAIRNSNVQVNVKTRELADFAEKKLLTPQEVEQIADVRAEMLIDDPVDPRDNPLFNVGGSTRVIPPRAQSGWPHQDDAEFIEVMTRIVIEPDDPGPNGSEPISLDRQLEALRNLINRDEFHGDDWIGQSLDWCARVIGKLRRSIEPAEDVDNE